MRTEKNKVWQIILNNIIQFSFADLTIKMRYENYPNLNGNLQKKFF